MAPVRWLWFLAVVLVPALGSLDRLKNCGKRDFCEGRKAEFLLPPELMTGKQRKSSQCFCDEKCAKYGDCCIDVAIQDNNDIESARNCFPLSYNQSIYAISKCGNRWPEDKRCLKTVSPDEYHYSLDVPVYSRMTGQHYANVYCALCNGENSSDIVTFKVRIECSNGSLTLHELVKDGKYQNGQLHWKIDRNKCYLGVQILTTGARECTTAITSCPDEADPEIVKKCKAYNLPLVHGNKEIYKNPHCALCNAVDLTNLSCWRGYDYRVLPSLSLIFDFNWDFDTCELPQSVWDGLRQCCTGQCLSDAPILDCGNVTACQLPEKPCHRSLSLKIEGYLTIICMSTSIFCLLIHLLLSFFLPQSKNLPGKILNSLSVSLLLAQTLFLCGIEPLVPIPLDACQAVAVFIQFFYLSSFFWMHIMSIDIWRTFSNASFKSQAGRSHTKYALYAWGGAGFVTSVSIITDLTDWLPEDYRPYYAAAPNICWFANRTGLGIFFFFPICIILILNTLMFGITVYWFQKQHKQSELLKNSSRKEYTRLWLYIKLFTIMGLTWVCGMVSTFANKPNYKYPFIVLNGLQGTFLFIMFDLKTQILHYIFRKTKLSCLPRNSDSKTKKNNGTTSTKLSTTKQFT